MNTEEKRIKIAEACGWSRSFIGDGIDGWRMPDRVTAAFESDLPDYFNDLNAMHEAEKVLQVFQRDKYTDYLCGLTPCDYDGWFSCAHATAAQRAESFGLTLNLWKE